MAVGVAVAVAVGVAVGLGEGVTVAVAVGVGVGVAVGITGLLYVFSEEFESAETAAPRHACTRYSYRLPSRTVESKYEVLVRSVFATRTRSGPCPPASLRFMP